MHFTTTLIPLLSILTLTSAQAGSSYDLPLYTDSECSIAVGGLDGTGPKNCTILPTTSTSTSSSCYTTPEELYMQATFPFTCEINFYSDSCCADQVGGTTSPPNLGCISAGDAAYYSVTGC